MINEFKGKYFYLSNFYEAPVTYDGITYGSNEAAFQAQKTINKDDRYAFAELNPSLSKKRGRHVKLRADWEDVKDGIMKDIVLAKFTQNENLKAKLLATNDAYLIEGNTWGDKYWGQVNRVGKNKLGHILMEVRDELKNIKR